MEDDLPSPTVAVLSDIHGVLPALDAVLAEPDIAVADRIVRSPASDAEALTTFAPRGGRPDAADRQAADHG